MTYAQLARLVHETNRAFCISVGDDSQVSWEEAPGWQKDSAIKGVVFAIEHPNAPASSHHDAWLSGKMIDGWKYWPVKDAEKKEHPCIVSFEELPAEQQAKDALFKAVVGVVAEYLPVGLQVSV